jgi:hypothetical protein
MKLRVKPIVTLPFTLTRGNVEYVFNPECEVPDALGEAYLKTQPTIYELAGEEPADLSQYTFSQKYKSLTISQLVDKLSDQHQADVHSYAYGLLKEEAEAKKEVLPGEPDQPKNPFKGRKGQRRA